jgi:hypothetical protein
MLVKRCFLVLFVAFALVTAAAQANITSRFGVAVQSCVVNQGGNGATNGINVVYTNNHASPATQVNFLIAYRGHRYILVDHGTFSQGAQINHNLTNDLVGYAWSGPTPNRCTVQRVYLANGAQFGP